jgi:hypothetical protein
MRSRFIILTAITAVQGVAFLGYAAYIAVNGLRFGVTGPAEVSNTPSLILQVVIFASFGAALMVVARGWWKTKRWARAPFVLAQILAVIVGWPLSSAEGPAERAAGVVLLVMAIAGLILAFSPKVTRVLEADA